MVSPLLVPVWVAGLLAPFRRPGWRALRFVSITYVGAGRPVPRRQRARVLPREPLPGAARSRRAARPRSGCCAAGDARWLLGAAVALSARDQRLIALPLLPERDLQGSVVMALNPAQGETVGWPRFVQTVAERVAGDPAARASPHGDLHRQLRRGRRDRSARTGMHRLPRAYSGHNGFSEWGIPPRRRHRCAARRLRRRGRSRAVLRAVPHARDGRRRRRPRQRRAGTAGAAVSGLEPVGPTLAQSDASQLDRSTTQARTHWRPRSLAG